MQGWIKLHRKLLEWEWYKDSKMVHLFLHLILEANHQDKQWKGIIIKRGQLVAGRKALSLQTGISEQSIRTSLKKLKSTNEITIKPTNRFSLITVCNYDAYNNNECDINQQSNQQSPNKQPATNQQLTTNKNVKKDKNVKKEKNIYTPEFELFWKQYPRREEKQDAFAEWKKLNPDAELQEVILKAVEQQKKTGCLKEAKYAPYAVRWVKKSRWTDELPHEETLTEYIERTSDGE